jgi:tetratricopeptide (TPR) repeat protein/serine/threonine protein kinase
VTVDFAKLQEVFLAAVEYHRPDDWEAYLSQACADDELRRQVKLLLQAHVEAGSVPGAAAREEERTGAYPAAAEAPGQIIGPYKLVEQIGEGGMGSVWMAQQQEPVKRLVAVKLIKAGMDSKQVIARFEAERQALALMDHAHIARVLDGGATGAGRPYFVMDLVKGMPITKYCDEHHLTPRQRLELFLPVCQAVQHAHQKGIIHRDLKPSNVLVALYDGKPVPKVIDFGVAKAAGQSLTEKTLVTGFGNIVGTLEYMSPEQAEINQLDIDTRSDIYSLGVLLYELLTGSPPFSRKESEQGGMLEMLRVIREQEPTKSSTKLSTAEGLPTLAANRGTDPAKLTKLVRGELDWIVMKALDKDRNRRYETANAFAADVQRYLADEPVLACPPSVGYRIRKFARRNKRGLVTVAALSVAILVAVAALGWAVRDRQVHEQELARKAERDLALAEQGVRQAIEQAAKIRGELHAVLTKPGGVQELLNQPGRWNFLIQSAQSELAQARRSMARTETPLSTELTQSLHKLEEQVSGDEADRLLAVQLEKIRLDQATWVEDNFDIRTAAVEYPQAFSGFAVLNADAAAVAARLRSSPIREQLVAALDDWAIVAYALRNEPLADRLLAVARQAAPDPAWADRLRQVKAWRDKETLGKLVEEVPVTRLSPQMLVLVGRLLPDQSSLRESWLRRAQFQYPADFWLNFELAGVLLKTQPLEATGFIRVALAIRPTTTMCYNNLGNALRDQKNLSEAIDAYGKAIEIDPKFAIAYFNLGNALRDQKNLDKAVACHKKAIELDPTRAGAHNNLGLAMMDQHKLDDAIACFMTAIQHNPKYGLAHLNLGLARCEQGDLDEAIACYQKAIDFDPILAVAHNALGFALQAQKKLPEALDAFHKAVETDPNYAVAHCNLGNALSQQGKLNEAVASYKKAIELDPTNANALNGLASALARQNKPDDAIACFRKAFQLDPKDAKLQYNLGTMLKAKGELKEAVACFRKAIELNPKYVEAYNNLGLTFHDQKKWAEVVACYGKAIELDPKHLPAHINLGNAYLVQRKLDEAIAAYRVALSHEKNDRYTRDALAWCLGEKSWELANDLDDQKRDPVRAVTLTKEAVDLTPASSGAWRQLGAAQYRAGNWKESLTALQKSMELRKGGDSFDWFFLAMAHWQLGEKGKARDWHDRAAQWMDKNQPKNEELRRFRAEATELLELKEKK